MNSPFEHFKNLVSASWK